jgi:GT2 family glycosyltransferase
VPLFGVVVIGRNEGERLRRCLASVASSGAPVVYVDSGSSDGSAEWASAAGHLVVELDLAAPFTAARARNAGAERLLEAHPSIDLVQFVDGDCEVAAGWLERAAAELAAEPGCGAVCGRTRERFRELSLYNRLCDIEWDAPAGIVRACGGIAMMRARAFREVGGFDPSIIAGEDDELCVRVRRAGWTIRRLDVEMVLHDAAMTRFGQWWTRAVRAGHCFAEGFALHGGPPEHLWRRKNGSVLFSAAVVPIASLGAAWASSGASLLLLAWYPLSVGRAYRNKLRRGMSRRDARDWAVFCMLANFPNLLGQARYVLARTRRRRVPIIEYRASTRPGSASRST